MVVPLMRRKTMNKLEIHTIEEERDRLLDEIGKEQIKISGYWDEIFALLTELTDEKEAA